MDTLYLMLNRTRNVVEILSRKEEGFPQKRQADAYGDVSGPVREKKEVAAGV